MAVGIQSTETGQTEASATSSRVGGHAAPAVSPYGALNVKTVSSRMRASKAV